MESKKVKPKKPSNQNQGIEKSSTINDSVTKSNNPSTENAITTSSKKKRHRKKPKNKTKTTNPGEGPAEIVDSKNPQEVTIKTVQSSDNPEEAFIKIIDTSIDSKESTVKTIEPIKSLKESIVKVTDSAKNPQKIAPEKKLIVNEPKSTSVNKNASFNTINNVVNNPVNVEKPPQRITETKPAISSIETIKMDPKTEKSREEIKAEREAKKLAKQLAKNKPKTEKGKSADAAVASITKLVQNVTISPAAPTLPDKVQPKPEVIKEKVIQNEKQAKTDDKKAIESQEKSKAELRAERRAKQEAQRAAKVEITDKSKVKGDKKENVAPKKDGDKVKSSLTDDAKIEMKKSIINEKTKSKSVQNRHKVKLFNHLYTEEENINIPLNSKSIPPVIVRLGLQYRDLIVVGSNARCIALLRALRIVVKDFVVSPKAIFSRDLEMHLDDCMKFLKSCRPHAVSMDNAIKCIKAKLRNTHDTEEKAKGVIDDYIETYINEQIEVAGKAISNSVNEKIAKGDTILTYGCSTLIEKILVDASANPEKEFSVVVVAANPWNEGREMLRRLTAKNIDCSLVMISALSFIMHKINKVILGAGALLANGYVMARAGTAQVAMVANAYNVPVLVCCETHKFSERAQTDSFVYNEIGDPDALIRSNPMGNTKLLQNWRDIKTLTPLNLTYDVTPPDLVTSVVTELAILPCTSVPVVLRLKMSET